MTNRTAAYLAAAWAIAFAAPHLYWATGRKDGLDTALSTEIVDDAGTTFALGCAGIALFCLCGALTALATLRWPIAWTRLAWRYTRSVGGQHGVQPDLAQLAGTGVERAGEPVRRPARRAQELA